MNRVIGNLFLILALSSFVVASSTTVGFVIRDEDESVIEAYTQPESSPPRIYLIGILIVGILIVFVGGLIFLKLKSKKKSKKSIVKKSVLKKSVTKKVSPKKKSVAKKRAVSSKK